MSWSVVKDFADATDRYYVYRAGDTFPRVGKQVSEKRLAELSSDTNRCGVPLIKEDADERKTTVKTRKSKKKE